jgi:hypothetical protein
MFTIATGRYNNDTWNECIDYRKRKNLSCIYGSPHEMSPKIYYDSPVFVIEMNNSTNKIEGIGLIKNKPITDKVYRLHKDANYNRYIYIGNFHADRKTLEYYNPQLVYVLDEILFKGKTHSKRGAGLMTIPTAALKLEVCDDIDIKHEIKSVFIQHFREKILIKETHCK